MRNKMLCFLLTGTLLTGIWGGAVGAVEFAEEASGNVEIVNEENELPLFSDIMEGVELPEDSELPENIELPEGSELPENVELPEGNELLENVELPENSEQEEGVELPEGSELQENIELPESSELLESGELPENSELSEESDYEFTIFSDGNADVLEAVDVVSKDLIEEIESGRIIAFAPAAFSEIQSSDTVSVFSEESVTLSALTDTAYTITSGAPIYCDEVWTYENSAYPSIENGFAYTDSRYRQCTVDRKIRYVDADGTTRTSPLYCLEASQGGINPGSEGQIVQDAAISLINNATMKKILYFGYGGPGDSCGEYDPTCSHIDWANRSNRYIFTHYALSKVYSGEMGHATNAEIEHVGLNKFLSYIKTLTIPDRKAVRIAVKGSDGNTVTGTNLSLNLSLHRELPDKYMEGMEIMFPKGYQLSPLMKVSDEGNAGNGLRITSSATDEWRILFWRTEEEYESTLGPEHPYILARGKSTVLQSGAYFYIAFPENMTESVTFSYQMSLYPVSFLLVDGDVQTGSSGMQDMGAYVYQDSRGVIKLTMNPAPRGKIQVNKSSHFDDKKLKNAAFSLQAAQDLYSGNELIYQKGEKIEDGITDANGNYVFENLIPGKYYLQETAAPSRFLKDTVRYEKTVSNGKITMHNAVNIPDLKGYVEIDKYVEGTKLHLKDAQFTIYSWDENQKGYYGKIVQMSYDENKKLYRSPELTYTAENKGKFKIVETKNPQGYSGDWSEEIVLKNQSGVQKFEFEAENRLADEKIVEIQKICADTGKMLRDAQFTIYEYNSANKQYNDAGNQMFYDDVKGKYVSTALMVTDENGGRFKIVETKNPDGYTGTWEQEINILNISQNLQFIVTNTPILYPKGMISIKKTDALTGALLEDAEFTIYPWDKERGTYLENPFSAIVMSYDFLSQRYVSDELEINPYNGGKFKITETKNPEGYRGKWEREVVLTEDVPEIYLEVENDPEDLPLGSITVVKKIKEQDITWAHGNPVFHFVVDGTDLQGKHHKYENYIRFTKGNYTVDEKGYAQMHCIFSKIPVGSYKIYEKSVLRYYLKDAYANTSNAAVVKGVSPAYGIEPKSIAYGTAVLDSNNLTASFTFINEKKRYDDYSHTSVLKNIMPSLSLVNNN